MVNEFNVGDRVVCVVKEYGGYTYGDELYMREATVSPHPNYHIYPNMLYVQWDKPCSRPDGGYHRAAFEPIGGPW